MAFVHMLGRPLIILTVCWAVAFCLERPSSGSSPSSQLRDCLPAKVDLLRELTKEMPGADRSRVADPNSKWTRRAANDAFNWIVKTVERDWLPPDPNVLRASLVMIQNAFGPNDVTYSQWEANNHVLQVAQMKTVILIRVRPASADRVRRKLTKEACSLLARDIIAHLVSKEADVVVYEPTGIKKTKKMVTPEVLAASFEHADVRACTDGIHGKCAAPELLEKKVHHYRYWWRCINWWTDGIEVGLYTLKAEDGPWIPDYHSNLDATWFEGPRYVRKSQDKP